ncbi:tetraspanin-8-like [Haliotis rufescens]|uniref:tetraspanin-8-like n=1 Tax=Haliotis rufescens TaxID=6454 RepID=UPI001EAFD6B7|nr:tetraspanin-8-like [Haliotis rufescens]
MVDTTSMCSSIKSCLKFCIVFINVIILLAGGAALGVGIWIVIDEDSFFNTLYPHLLDVSTIDKEFLRHAAIVLATGGAGTVFFALLGIAAAVTSSTCLLGLYITVITLVIAVEVAAVILGIVFKKAWERELENELNNSMKMKYGPPSDGFTTAMNLLQAKKMCCGWTNGSDYVMTGSQWNRTLGDGSSATIPDSCCKMENATLVMANCTTEPTADNSYFNQGCKSSLSDLFVNYQACIIGFGAGIAGLEFFMLLLAIVLIANNDSNKYNMS